jgi:acetyltransferase-like isoleucine patch superfamily enzyme
MVNFGRSLLTVFYRNPLFQARCVTWGKGVSIDGMPYVSGNLEICVGSLRAQGLPPRPKDVCPVRICRNAWVGNGAHIMKGVTIGEGAIIGANKRGDFQHPPFSLAMGNPAEVLIKNVGLPCTARVKKGSSAGPQAR